MTGLVVDLFAGIRGWGTDGVGFELDRDACSTQAALGAPCVRADIVTWPLDQFAGRVGGITASPPCQTFSTAGKQDGIAELGRLLDLISGYDGGPIPTIDGKTELVVEPLRWTLALRPEWLCCEQVPAVLPIWERMTHRLREHGYSTWCGILNSADYGVPQTRKRAILIASRVRTVGPPAPTHAETPGDALFGQLSPWVSMADALGWTGKVGFPLFDDRGDSPDGYRERDWRSTDYPAFAVTATARSWTLRTGDNSRGATGPYPYERSCDAPAPTIDRKAGMAWKVAPATTIGCDPHISSRCHHDTGMQGANAVDVATALAGGHDDRPVKLTVADALRLQSFPAGWPVQGTKTAKFRQIGNAIPPALARAVRDVAARNRGEN
jgi:DNA (cytosine-5)-methyltransferase 1